MKDSIINKYPFFKPFRKQTVDIDRIKELKSLLTVTDYQAIKYAEGWFSDKEYQPIKEQRQQWRDEINEIERHKK